MNKVVNKINLHEACKIKFLRAKKDLDGLHDDNAHMGEVKDHGAKL
jgi:hypothetical protein